MRWWHWIKEALFPARCLLCKREGQWLCKKHAQFVPAPKNETVFYNLDDILAATAYYHDTSKRLVEHFKFRGGKELAKIMAEQLSPILQNVNFQNYTIIPIPLHWTRKLWRGFNQAEVLARELQKKMPERNIETGLIRRKRTSQQARLGKKERQKNVDNAFFWGGKTPPPQNILLLDDVVASGSTLDAAARILKKNGAQKVVGLVFARGGKACQNLRDED